MYRVCIMGAVGIAPIRGAAPQVSEEKLRALEELIGSDPKNNASGYLVNDLFFNSLRKVPSDMPDVQEAVIDLGMHYFGHFRIKTHGFLLSRERHTQYRSGEDPIMVNMATLTTVLNYLLSPKMIRQKYGNSNTCERISKAVADEILDFYTKRRSGIHALRDMGELLLRNLQYLYKDWTPDTSANSYNLQPLSRALMEWGTEDPGVLKGVWVRVKHEYQEPSTWRKAVHHLRGFTGL